MLVYAYQILPQLLAPYKEFQQACSGARIEGLRESIVAGGQTIGSKPVNFGLIRKSFGGKAFLAPM